MDELLRLAGYRVITAETGLEGLTLARAHPPHLILCDIMMPDLDGFGVLSAVQHISGLVGVPFVFVTAKSGSRDVRKGMNAGSDDYLIKPFTGDELLRLVSARLAKNALYKEGNKGDHSNGGMDTISETAITLEALLENRIHKKLKKKDTVFVENDVPSYLYFLKSGKIKTVRINGWGKEYITHIFNKGDFFGYIPLLKDSEHKETASALEESEIVLIPGHDFFRLLYSDSELSLRFIKMISNNLSLVEEWLLKLAYDSARRRVAEALLYMQYKYNGGKKENCSFPAHRENISSIAGISAESVSRNLTDFKEEGLIHTDNKIIRILNEKKLESIR